MQGAIGAFENAPGHHYQSATESSWNTWNAGSGVGGDRNTTISYYNNGAMLGAMLDLKIRGASQNRKSLDDVMRALYQTYYLQKHRGFTDAEFRQECETAAGADLAEVLSYASTTTDVNYANYFAYAGLKLTAAEQDAAGAYLGVNTHLQEIPPNAVPSGSGRGGRSAAPETALVITSVSTGSPAVNAGLMAGDRILEIEGVKATPKAINDLLIPARTGNTAVKKPGEKIKLKISRNGAAQDVDVLLSGNITRTYHLQITDTPTPMQSAILKDWLRAVQ
jgi:predicted metalloprotease with PDZ domain